MIEFTEVMFRALTGLRLTFPNLISLAAFFAAGYYFAAMTKRLGPLKVILVLFVAYLLSTLLSGLLGVYTLAVVLGFVSNQGLFLARAVLWVESFAEFVFVMRHRMAFEDIRQAEAATERASQKPNNSGQTRESWSNRSGGGASGRGAGAQNNAGNWTPGPGKSAQDIARCLKILELDPGQAYTAKDVKKAYRRLAMIHHPDLETGSNEAMARIVMAREYLSKHGADPRP